MQILTLKLVASEARGRIFVGTWGSHDGPREAGGKAALRAEANQALSQVDTTVERTKQDRTQQNLPNLIGCVTGRASAIPDAGEWLGADRLGEGVCQGVEKLSKRKTVSHNAYDPERGELGRAFVAVTQEFRFIRNAVETAVIRSWQ